MSSADIDAYIAHHPPAFAAALTALRARLCALLPESLLIAIIRARQAEIAAGSKR